MHKTEHVKKMAEILKISIKESEENYNVFIKVMEDALLHGTGVYINNFGSIKHVDRKARVMRNPYIHKDPSVSEFVDVPASVGVKFKASAVLKRKLNP